MRGPSALVLAVLDRVTPEARRRWAARTLLASCVAWPATQLTVARQEPPVVLGLSWLAVVLTCVDIIVTTDVRAEVDQG